MIRICPGVRAVEGVTGTPFIWVLKEDIMFH